MSPLNKALAICGVAKQVSAGTAAANPTFAHGVVTGPIIKSELKQGFADTTSGNAAPTNVDRTQATNGASFDMRSYLKSIGLYLLGLYGADVVTGASPYVHTFSLAASQPYLTVFESYNGVLSAVRDCKVTGITFKWKTNEPVIMTAVANGTVYSVPLTFTPTTDDTGSESFLVQAGGTFQVAVVGAVPATARVADGEIDIKFDTDPVFVSGSLEAADPGARTRMEATVKLTVIPDDLSYWNIAATGTANGTAISPSVQYGSLAITFKENAGGLGSLVVTGSKVAFLCERPTVDPKGGTLSLALAGQAVMDGTTAPLVMVLTNSTATY
jgi:hypothetical protein